MPAHHDTTAKTVVAPIEPAELFALGGLEEALDHAHAERVERLVQPPPVGCANPIRQADAIHVGSRHARKLTGESPRGTPPTAAIFTPTTRLQ